MSVALASWWLDQQARICFSLLPHFPCWLRLQSFRVDFWDSLACEPEVVDPALVISVCVCVLAGSAFCTLFCFGLVCVCVLFCFFCFDLVCVCVLAGSAFCTLFCFGLVCVCVFCFASFVLIWSVCVCVCFGWVCFLYVVLFCLVQVGPCVCCVSFVLLFFCFLCYGLVWFLCLALVGSGLVWGVGRPSAKETLFSSMASEKISLNYCYNMLLANQTNTKNPFESRTSTKTTPECPK